MFEEQQRGIYGVLVIIFLFLFRVNFLGRALPRVVSDFFFFFKWKSPTIPKSSIRNAYVLIHHLASSVVITLPCFFHLLPTPMPLLPFVLELYFKASLRYQAISSLRTLVAICFYILFLMGQAALPAEGLLWSFPWHCALCHHTGLVTGLRWCLRNRPQALGMHKNLEQWFSA